MSYELVCHCEACNAQHIVSSVEPIPVGKIVHGQCACGGRLVSAGRQLSLAIEETKVERKRGAK